MRTTAGEDRTISTASAITTDTTEEIPPECRSALATGEIPLRYLGYALLQEKWVLFIVEGLLDGPLGFNELSRRTHRVNATTLTQRLELLESQGIVEKTIHSTMPPRTSYALTEKGRSLRPVLEAIDHWATENLTSEIPTTGNCPSDSGAE